MLGLGTLRRVVKEVRSDVAAARDRDPAARGISSIEILGSWAGVKALLAHRVAHALHAADMPLGPITVGHGARVGANTLVVEDVPARSTVVGNPGHPVKVEGRKVEGPDADWIHLPDPVADAIKALSERIAELEARLAELAGGERPDPGVRELRPKRGRSSAGG
jgi:serine acetyltransferase